MLTGAPVQDQKQNQTKIKLRGLFKIMTEHVLYRYFDEDGELLYIGITNDPGRRWSQHIATKPWARQISTIRLEAHPDRVAVLAAEREAIQSEHPRYNVVHAARLTPAPVAENGPRPRRCPCGAPARILFVLYREIFEYEQRRREWRERVRAKNQAAGRTLQVWDGDDMRTMPGPTPWRVSCDEHAPSSGNPYEIPYPTTWKSWVDWSAHLLEKEWFPDTNWSQLLYGAGCADRD